MSRIETTSASDIWHSQARRHPSDFSNLAIQEVLRSWDKFGGGNERPKLAMSDRFRGLSDSEKSNVVRAANTAFTRTIENEAKAVDRGVRDGCRNVVDSTRSAVATSLDLLSSPQKRLNAAQQCASIGREFGNRAVEYALEAEAGNVQPLTDARRDDSYGVFEGLERTTCRLQDKMSI